MSHRYHHPRIPQAGSQLTLTRSASHHLLQVRRHPRGESLLLFDGHGQQALCRLVAVEAGCAVIECLERLEPVPAPTERLVLLLGLCKAAALETALRMATELGATELHGFVAERSNQRRLREDRWRRVLISACEQCGRSWLPSLHAASSLEQALAAGELPPQRLLLSPGSPPLPRPQGSVTLLAGPEGGLAERELGLAHRAGFQDAGLGPHTLRVDTAVAAALARYAPSRT